MANVGRRKGTPKTGGRLPGVKNRANATARDAMQWAFDHLGGAQALAVWGKQNETEFYKLYGRLIPVDTTTGGKPINFSNIKLSIVRPEHTSS